MVCGRLDCTGAVVKLQIARERWAEVFFACPKVQVLQWTCEWENPPSLSEFPRPALVCLLFQGLHRRFKPGEEDAVDFRELRSEKSNRGEQHERPHPNPKIQAEFV